MTDAWESAELSAVGVDVGDALDTDDVSELPEVRAARVLGWESAHEAPLWCFRPAVWPVRARAWLPDRRFAEHARTVVATAFSSGD